MDGHSSLFSIMYTLIIRNSSNTILHTLYVSTVILLQLYIRNSCNIKSLSQNSPVFKLHFSVKLQMILVSNQPLTCLCSKKNKSALEKLQPFVLHIRFHGALNVHKNWLLCQQLGAE